MDYIPLERPIQDLDNKIDELKRLAASQAINLDSEIKELQDKAVKLRKDLFSNLSNYERVQLSRHPNRPNSLELIGKICSSFVELHGDRNFFDDKAIVGGLASVGKTKAVFIGHQKGHGTKENIYRNFGMPTPEGYRKALRLMSMAERFHLPIITFIDTPGAYPGVGAEERGQSEAIAKNIFVMSRLKVPIISIVVGEGGSGGALALAVANKIHMMENAVYSVISPEGCASILFKDSAKAAQAAQALKITANDALRLGIIDSVIKEPDGGAHRSLDHTAEALKKQIIIDLKELSALDGEALREHRMEKFFKMGIVSES